MICTECTWEGNLRREFAASGVDFDTYADRPSMKGRGHQACRGGTWCCCQHRLPTADGAAVAPAGEKPAASAPAAGKRAVVCHECGKTVALYPPPNGRIHFHKSGGKYSPRCSGWRKLPK